MDVRLWHPRFADAPERVRLQVAFVFLDSLIGEEDVERRVGEIELLEAPTGGLTPAELKASIDRHKAGTTRDETWVVRDVPNAEGHDCSDDSAT